jgi:hypothetical protein
MTGAEVHGDCLGRCLCKDGSSQTRLIRTVNQTRHRTITTLDTSRFVSKRFAPHTISEKHPVRSRICA